MSKRAPQPDELYFRYSSKIERSELGIVYLKKEESASISWLWANLTSSQRDVIIQDARDGGVISINKRPYAIIESINMMGDDAKLVLNLRRVYARKYKDKLSTVIPRIKIDV